ncbi:hypothetical protein A5675_26510 [Mycobacterium malmoense]|uniref:Uncharacterized protein n=2 Tax=Mycobacterium malmoense TaxID=1780 RepID=A0A1B9DDY0_MYCMA|nr:hypothetical protein A5675_26510 [Mycobacterium malmoense]OCB62322.1 hypothetical protein A5677_11810 [Mycobacterium malmoense]
MLSEVERSQILRQVIDTKVNSQAGTITEIHTTGSVLNTGGFSSPMSATSTVTSRRTGPRVLTWGNTWAIVGFGNWLTHPAVIALGALLSIFTCGLYLPWWFYRTFKKPPLYTLVIDEYGRESWTQHEIPRGQRVLRWVLLGVLIVWAIMALDVLGTLGQAAGPQ